MSLFTKTDVTAVKLFRDCVFAGIGSYINVFYKESRQLLQRIHALRGQKIYGFVPSPLEDKILIFGGKQFTVCSVDGKLQLSVIFPYMICDDWLHAAVWINDSEVALLTAHNVVQRWDVKSQSMLSAHKSTNNSILYSGLLVPLVGDVLVFAGTVFSEVLVHQSTVNENLLTLKGHRGVIFSISCDLNKELIVTTSDDRSVRIWGPKNKLPYPANTLDYWKNVQIECRHEVYGHTARVMRSLITNDKIISVGEDSAICLWKFGGELLKKINAHQNGCIWALDADKIDLVTGGGDAGVILHPITVAIDFGEHDLVNLEGGNPKKIAFTSRNNIVILTEKSELNYYDIELKYTTNTFELKHESTYILMSLSSCKQIIAVVDICGNLDVFIENCKGEVNIKNVTSKKLNLGKVLSMQWAGNRHIVLCGEDGAITILASKEIDTEVYSKHLLPTCKERWLTAAVANSTNDIFVIGDRCGNIHVYSKHNINPIKTFTKVHGRYGPTSINIINNEIITTGRDGTVKYFYSKNNDENFKLRTSKDVPFEWVEKFLDKSANMICGFQERIFTVHDLKNNSHVIDVPCGGGHRTWDAVRSIDKLYDKYEEMIKLIYVKNSAIHISQFQLSKVVSKHITKGTHVKEINCLKSLKTDLHDIFSLYISGGEDTTLRISTDSVDISGEFQDEIICKHLSNIRALKTMKIDENKILVVTAGGRAQICINMIELNKSEGITKYKTEALIDHLIKGTDKERKGNQNWRNKTIDFDPETRIMDLDIIKRDDDNNYTIYCGCSDAYLRIFEFKYNSNKKSEFKELQEYKYHKTCILKTHIIHASNIKILLTCTTRGVLAFWDITKPPDSTNKGSQPFYILTTNKSGIDSVASKNISPSEVIITTGGDDNAIHVNTFKILTNDGETTAVQTHTFCVSNWHCSQVTGLSFVDDFLVSTSIDQRVTLSTCKVDDDGVKCEFVSQCYTDVSDVQGLDVVEVNSESIVVCVFGKGMELIQISKPR